MYCAYGDYNDLMKFTEEMLETCARDVTGGVDLEYQGEKINFQGPFRKVRMADAIKEVTGIDTTTLNSFEGEVGDSLLMCSPNVKI